MTRIARYIDDPPGVFFWEMDEIIVFSFFMGVGIFMDSLFSMLMIGVGGATILGKVKKKQSEGFFLHFLCWHGILPMKDCPPSYIRTFIE